MPERPLAAEKGLYGDRAFRSSLTACKNGFAPASKFVAGGRTAEISANAANLLSDTKPRYMRGGGRFPLTSIVNSVINVVLY